MKRLDTYFIVVKGFVRILSKIFEPRLLFGCLFVKGFVAVICTYSEIGEEDKRDAENRFKKKYKIRIEKKYKKEKNESGKEENKVKGYLVVCKMFYERECNAEHLFNTA